MDTDYLGKKGWRLLKGLLTGILIAACCSSLSFAGSAGAKKLNIKGLYIGMTLYDAKVIAEIFTDLTNYKLMPFNLSQYKFRAFQCDEHKYWFSDVRRSVVSPIVFATDANKRITFISIQGTLVDKLFNSADHTAKQFVQEFSDMNNILQMTEIASKPKSPLPNILPSSGWTYLSSHGFRITVFSNKDIDIEKTEKRNAGSLLNDPGK